MSVFTSDVTVEPGTAELLVNGSAHIQPISGAVSVSNFPATQPVSGTVAVSSISGSVAVTGTLTDAQLRATPVPISGTVSVGAGASSATITRVATSAVSATLLAANVNRKKAIIMTETGATQYVAFGSAASATNYTYMLGSTTVLEVTNWTGSITLARSTGTGNVQVTELV